MKIQTFWHTKNKKSEKFWSHQKLPSEQLCNTRLSPELTTLFLKRGNRVPKSAHIIQYIQYKYTYRTSPLQDGNHHLHRLIIFGESRYNKAILSFCIKVQTEFHFTILQKRVHLAIYFMFRVTRALIWKHLAGFQAKT